jgi:hypothetical protein
MPAATVFPLEVVVGIVLFWLTVGFARLMRLPSPRKRR